MTELHLPWLEIAIAAPLVGALWIASLRDPETAWRHSLFFSGLALFCAVGAWIDFGTLHTPEAHDRWSLGWHAAHVEPFVIDKLSAPLLPMAALLYFLTSATTMRTKVRRLSFGWILVSEAILLATLSCRNSWGIIGLLALGVVPPLWELRARRRSIRIFAVHMGVCMTMLAVGWAAIEQAGAAPPIWAIALLMAAILIRSGIVPTHCWMTDLFEHASFGAALLFATPMVGVYAAIRLLLPMAPDWALRSIALISLFTAVYAAGMALVQRDARRFFCYLLLSHSSLVLVGLEIATPVGLTGALCLWISTGLALTGFGLTLRAVEARKGRLLLSQFHGLYEHMPSLAAFFLITGMASIGFPGTIGFVGAELLIEGAVDVYPLVGMAVVLAAALNGIAVLQAYLRIFTGTRYFPSISLRSSGRERLAVLTLAALIFGGGMFPQPGLTSRYDAATDIIGARRHAMGLAVRDERSRDSHWLTSAFQSEALRAPEPAAKAPPLASTQAK